MALPGTIEITYHNDVKGQNPVTAVLFDMIKANEMIVRLKALELRIVEIVVR